MILDINLDQFKVQDNTLQTNENSIDMDIKCFKRIEHIKHTFIQ